MPKMPKVPCAHPGCPELVDYGEKYCDKHKPLHLNDDRKTSNERGYNARWRKARKRFLAAHPLCEECKKKGLFVQATVVDHKIPHRGDPDLFWDESNWQALCKACHDKKTGRFDSKPGYSYRNN